MKLTFTHPQVLWLLLLFLPLLLLPYLPPGSRPGQRRLTVALRLLVGLLLILGLAGAQWVRPVEALTAVFLLDLSDSVPVAQQEQAEQFIRQAVAEMPEGDRAALVAFGERALVERLAAEGRDLPAVASVPGRTRTDLAAAVRLGLALFPEASQKRLVILSDGLENAGDVRALLPTAAGREVEIAVVPLSAPAADREASLVDLQLPETVRQGQGLAATAVVESSVAQQATVYLLADGEMIAAREVTLQPGRNQIAFPLTAEEVGFHRYRAELVAGLDTVTQNNVAAAFTVVEGPPQILVVAAAPERSDLLRRALASAGMEVTVVRPGEMPASLDGLGSYDVVVLNNVPATALPQSAMETLVTGVRELGQGLVMLGGEQSFGAGGYLRTPLEDALPVDMDVRSRTREPNVALVLAVDRSGSMGRCHCDDPDARPGEYERVESGLSKVDIAKDAVMMAREALGPLDYLGVVAFDEDALWALHLQQLVDAGALQNAVGGIGANGQTNIFAGLMEAEQALLGADARVKHILLLTDGWSQAGDYADLTARLAAEGITLSVVAAGSGSALYLEGLARAGGGRYYAAPTMQEVPQIFLRETMKTVGSYIIEEAFYPLPVGSSSMLRGLDVMSVPALGGYNGTTAKATAQVSLASPRGDPLLAQWQYGLGRAAAWTSDVDARWSAAWVTWEQFNTFVAQVVGWTLPRPAAHQLQTSLTLDGATVQVAVTAETGEEDPERVDGALDRRTLETEVTFIGPGRDTARVELERAASGHYEGQARLGEPGAYLVQVVQRDAEGRPVAQQTTGLIVPYSPEYRKMGDGSGLLLDLAQGSGGRVLDLPAGAFAPAANPAADAHPLAPALLLASILLFPLDVASRRLRLRQADWSHLGQRLRQRIRLTPETGPPAAVEPMLLGNLFAARERGGRQALQRRQGRHDGPSPSMVAPEEPTPMASGTAERAPTGETDTFARLRAAQRRAARR